MNTIEAKIFAAQLGNNGIPVLDLHGLYIDEALEKLELFLFDNYSPRDEKVIRIVYGGGTGRLGEAVRNCLDKHKLVVKIVAEHGSCLAVL